MAQNVIEVKLNQNYDIFKWYSIIHLQGPSKIYITTNNYFHILVSEKFIYLLKK